ncbi:MAG: DHA2 family efflux MFS transporter permease subunit, partial [Desulfobacterales bacterium]
IRGFRSFRTSISPQMESEIMAPDADSREKSPVNKWLIALTVMTGTLMSALDVSIVNVALPYMRGSLNASVEEITWVATGYLLSNVIIMPLIALFASRFGRKRFFMFSVLLFTASSVMCGTARSMTSMVSFRIIQGIGGGALMPVSQSILRETFPPEEQGMAMGIYGLGVVLGPAIGPSLGGWLTTNYSWPWIFYVNVPVGVINLMLVSRYIKDPPYLIRETGRIDFIGVGLLAVGLGCLQIMLEKGEQKQWFSSDFIKYLAVAAAFGLALFVWHELTTRKPAVNLRILKDVNFTGGTLIGGILGAGLYGTLFLMPLFLEQLLGYPALDAGLALMPRSLAMALFMPITGRLYNRIGARLLVGVGLAVSAFSFWQLSRLSLDVGFWDIVLPQFIQGIGFGMIFVALSTAALSTIDKPRMQAATGLYNVIRLVFGSVGIAGVATKLDNGTIAAGAVLMKNLTPYRDTVAVWTQSLTGTMSADGSAAGTAHLQSLQLIYNEVMRQATMISYNRVFFLVSVAFALTLPLVLILQGNKQADAGRMAVE